MGNLWSSLERLLCLCTLLPCCFPMGLVSVLASGIPYSSDAETQPSVASQVSSPSHIGPKNSVLASTTSTSTSILGQSSTDMLTYRQLNGVQTNFPLAMSRATSFCSERFDCTLNENGTFNSKILVQFDQPIETAIPQASLDDFFLDFIIAYELVAGAVCDTCRRKVSALDVLTPSSLAGRRQLQEAVSAEYVILNATIIQEGDCSNAFDNGDNLLALQDTEMHLNTCGIDFGSFVTGCCCVCDSISSTSGISRLDFREQLQLRTGTPILNVLEVETPENAEELCGEPQESFVEIFIAYDYVLPAENVTTFYGALLSTYNGLTLENCFPQMIRDYTVIDQQPGTVSNRRLRRTGSTLLISVSCTANICPVRSGTCGLFDCTPTRDLKEAESIAVSPTRLFPRGLAADPTFFSDQCICAVGDDLPERTNMLSTPEEFVSSFNANLAFLGIPPIIGIEDVVAETLKPTRPPKSKGKGTVNKGRKYSKGMGKGNASKGMGKGNASHSYYQRYNPQIQPKVKPKQKRSSSSPYSWKNLFNNGHKALRNPRENNKKIMK